MVIVGVIVVALAILFSLTAFALRVSGQLRHPARVGAALAGLFVLGLALMAD
jgi:hypothetical protein